MDSRPSQQQHAGHQRGTWKGLNPFYSLIVQLILAGRKLNDQVACTLRLCIKVLHEHKIFESSYSGNQYEKINLLKFNL